MLERTAASVVPALNEIMAMGDELLESGSGTDDMHDNTDEMMGRWPRQAHHSLAQRSMSDCTDVAAREQGPPLRLRRSIALCEALRRARKPQNSSLVSG